MKNVINKVTLTGNAGTEVQLKNFTEKQKLARVSLAVNEYYKNIKGEPVKRTNWFQLVFWNEYADQALEMIKKGTRLTVEGRLQSLSYQTKKGLKRQVTEIVVQAMQAINN